MSRLCVVVFVIINIVWSQAEDASADSAYTSPVLKRNRTNYLSFAGKTYYFGTIFRANFYRAMQFCRQQGMQLVSITTQAENDRLGRFVEEIGSHYSHFWTSGTNLGDEHQWIWLSTGNNFVYTNWHPGEPSLQSVDKVKENCVEARHFGKGFTWNDLSCQIECYFICESVDTCSK